MEVISIMSRKGGVGKTATAHALGAALMKRGKKVLFIDADGQCNLTLTMKAHEKGKNLFNVFMGECSLKDAIEQTSNGYIIPGNEDLQAIDVMLRDPDPNLILKRCIKDISKDFDYCIIDTSAALGRISRNVINISDKIVIPLNADIYSFQGIRRVIDAIEHVKAKDKSRAVVSGLLITQFDPRTTISKDLSKELKEIAANNGTRVFESKIRQCVKIREAAISQTDIYSYAPKSNAAVDYESFTNELLKAE